MKRNCTHLNHYFISPVLFCLVFISCVYFNTFYNAEISFKKALKIIEESPIIDDGIPLQAKKLLGEAVENSKLILKEYPESKYIDDAIFIIAKASFLRDEVAIAESHFKLLIRDYPNSKFYFLSEIFFLALLLQLERTSPGANGSDIEMMTYGACFYSVSSSIARRYCRWLDNYLNRH